MYTPRTTFDQGRLDALRADAQENIRRGYFRAPFATCETTLDLIGALIAERDRADRAEARIAQVEALRDKWMHDGEQPDLWIAVNKALREATA